jgi:hypothetical protein
VEVCKALTLIALSHLRQRDSSFFVGGCFLVSIAYYKLYLNPISLQSLLDNDVEIKNLKRFCNYNESLGAVKIDDVFKFFSMNIISKNFEFENSNHNVLWDQLDKEFLWYLGDYFTYCDKTSLYFPNCIIFIMYIETNNNQGHIDIISDVRFINNNLFIKMLLLNNYVETEIKEIYFFCAQ